MMGTTEHSIQKYRKKKKEKMKKGGYDCWENIILKAVEVASVWEIRADGLPRTEEGMNLS